MYTGVPPLMCGVRITFSIAHSSLSGESGSSSNTSRAAPAIRFSFRARTSAASSMTAPRAMLMMRAVGFIAPSSRSPMR